MEAQVLRRDSNRNWHYHKVKSRPSTRKPQKRLPTFRPFDRTNSPESQYNRMSCVSPVTSVKGLQASVFEDGVDLGGTPRMLDSTSRRYPGQSRRRATAHLQVRSELTWTWTWWLMVELAPVRVGVVGVFYAVWSHLSHHRY